VSVTIGVDPHKGSHTALAIDGDEASVGELKVRATRRQVAELLEWAEPFEKRTWAVESAGGLGYLLSQQLVAAGEAVVDVPATLAARVRLLGSGRSGKNDPNDARSVAIAALRAPQLAVVEPADHATVLRLLAKRHLDLGRARNRTACRLHALLAELVPGGIASEIHASQAQLLLDAVVPATAPEAARRDIAQDHVDDLRRLDDQIRSPSAAWKTRLWRQAPRSPSCSGSARSPRAASSATAETSDGSGAATALPCTTARHRSTCPPAGASRAG
jgi:hypothetical protein